MKLLEYILLGLVQGLTETIPVSSSGHLMIVKTLLNAKIDYDALSIMTNFGSLIAIFIIFWDDIIELLSYFFKYLKNKNKLYLEDYKYCWMIALGCIPTGLAGLVVAKLELFEKIENNIKIVGISLIITSILLFVIRNFKGTKDDNKIGVKEALTVGFFQIMGLFPGSII